MLRSAEHNSLPEFVEPQETWVNVGEPPLIGLVEKGRSDRKTICEDVKMNDPTRGLFLVADGVVDQGGLFAAREIAAVVVSTLGETFEKELERIGRTQWHDLDQHQRFMDRHIRSQMERAIRQADHQIHTFAQLRPDWHSTGASVSLCKRIVLPDRGTYLYVTQIGEGCQLLLRNKVLHRLAQAVLVDDEEPTLVGHLSGKDFIVKRLRVRQSDRCVLLSKGASNQLIEKQIASILSTQSEDRAAERALQQEADAQALRAMEVQEGDDVSAVVHTIR